MYYYDDYEPEWLGSNIYSYLEGQGNFKNTLQLIDDLGYAEMMQGTGSITLFAANDSAFTEFYKSNSWGVKKYDDLSLAQRKMLLNYSIIKNAYLMETVENYFSANTFHEGMAMRRETKYSFLDSLPFEKGDKLPTSKYWNNYRNKGLYLLKDATNPTLVYFTQKFLNKNTITDDDIQTITGSNARSAGDVHLFNIKVLKKDIVCKNGYVNVLSSVLVQPKNMAQYISDNPKLSIFSKLLDRFCAPYFDAENTSLYKDLYTGFSDSIFEKRYFASTGGTTKLPSGANAPNLLSFDPGWNGFNTSSIYADMATMIVPTDEAMNNYFNGGVGAILKNEFGSWDNIPDDIIIPFLKRHMRNSFIESVPSRFGKMVDAENYRLPMTKENIDENYTAVNGHVYVTNTVYPPVDFISVYSPVLLSRNAKIFKWAIDIKETSAIDNTTFAFYRLYLNSLVSKYSLFVPTDEYFEKYVDPVAYGQDGIQGVLKFWYNETTSSVNAAVYKYEKATGTVGDSVNNISDAAFLKNRLWNILDNHIVIGNIDPEKNYYVTKGNDIIKVTGSGESMAVQGGFDIENNGKSHVKKIFNQDNGKTYFVDRPIQSTMKSVYNVLQNTPEFSEFFSLVNGVPDTCVSQIFSQQGVDFRVSFFNAYRYTVYVPTNAAIQSAIDKGLITPWQQIYELPDKQRNVEIRKMIRFLRYHFQDDAAFYGHIYNETFQSATIKTDEKPSHFGTSIDKYYKIGIAGSKNSMVLTTESGGKAKVVTDNGLYNIVAKDFIFSKLPSAYKNVDGTGATSGALFSSSSVTTSASAVIHQIDKVLTFQ